MANLRLWYGTDPKPHADVVAAVNKIVAEHAETILPHMKIKDVTTHYVTSLEMQFGEHTLMLYKQSSKDHAIIAIDCRGIKRVLKGMPDGMTLSELIELTLIHEYAHAWIDMAGLKPADEEDVCNAFADALYEEPDNVKGAFAMLRQLARG